jgi:hypothetical protein
MKTISKRELSRKPSQLSAIQPGESVMVSDTGGGLIVTRPKRRRLTLDEMDAELQRLAKGCPKVDSLTLLQEGEA